MKARKIIKRNFDTLDEIHMAVNGIQVKPNCVFVQQGKVKKGDFVRLFFKGRDNYKIWERALGIIGREIKNYNTCNFNKDYYYLVCRPI